jgi:tetratricopeptide (TPR) repeat protein
MPAGYNQDAMRPSRVVASLFFVATSSLSTLSAQSRVDQLYAEAKAAQARGDHAEAISKYESILQIDRRLAPAYNNLGALHVEQGEYGKAADVLERGLKVDPSMASASALLGIARYHMGEYAKARGPLETALRANPNDDQARLTLARVHVKLADWEGAAEQLRRLSHRQPRNEEAWYLLGTVYMRLSEQALARLSDIDPDSSLVHQISGEVMESMKNYDGALLEYKKAVEKAPARPGVHYKLGNLYWTTAQWDAAAQEFQAELANDPRNCLAQWKLGNILLEQSVRAEEALGEIDKALAMCPTLTQARVDRGRASLKLGRHDDAVRDLQIAAQASPEEPSVHFFLAQAYRGLGRGREALAEMQAFARLEEAARAATAKRAQDVLRAKEKPQ